MVVVVLLLLLYNENKCMILTAYVNNLDNIYDIYCVCGRLNVQN